MRKKRQVQREKEGIIGALSQLFLLRGGGGDRDPSPITYFMPLDFEEMYLYIYI